MTRGSDRRKGTLYVLEVDPPTDRERWYCHWDGAEAPGFEVAEDAVAWGLERARGVVVRTIRTVFYLAGERPDDWGDGVDFRAWPPSPSEREEIDKDYGAAVIEAERDEAAWRAYEVERSAWIRQNAPESPEEPLHECMIALPGSDEAMSFEEFDSMGDVCAGRAPDGRSAFGSAAEVLASVARRTMFDPWLVAILTALERERTWVGFGRRYTVGADLGDGEMFHVTASGNRASIERHGLDWRRMSDHHGVAGARSPELEAIFLCETLKETTFFTRMARVPSDVWAVRVTGRWIEPGPSGWVIVTEPIPPSDVRLVVSDVEPRSVF